MLLAVMGNGSYLKRPWDDTELERSQHQRDAISTSAIDLGRRLSIDSSSPTNQRLPPIPNSHERPSQIVRHRSWTSNTDPEETSACRSPPQPRNEGSAKRPRLSYDQQDYTNADRFDLKSSTANSSVRISIPVSIGEN